MIFDPFGGSGVLFSVVPVVVTIGFIVVIGVIVYRGVQGARQWKHNNDSPVLTVDAKVVTKRADVSRYRHAGAAGDAADTGYSATSYYVTFEVPSGDRMEFHVQSGEYGLLAEGDAGRLTFQGTRYLGFARGA